MSVVDPTALARFAEARTAAPVSGRFAMADPSASPSSKWAQQRLRLSRSPIGAAYRGLEVAIGPDEALAAVAELHLRSAI